MDSIAVIGCGNIGRAVIEGMLQSGSELSVYATRRNLESIRDLESKGVQITSDNLLAVKNSQFIILGVKPYKAEELCKQITPALRNDQVLISLMSEVSIQQIRDWTKTESPIFRAMPNTAATIQESMTCIAHSDAPLDLIKKVEGFFAGTGKTVLIDEQLMEAATILGACGIAYAMRFIRAMVQGGIQIGFDAKTAAMITNQTVKGAASLLIENKNHPEAEIDKVTTPMGCTITGLNEMEHQGFSSSLIQGIVKSFDKIDHSAD